MDIINLGQEVLSSENKYRTNSEKILIAVNNERTKVL